MSKDAEPQLTDPAGGVALIRTYQNATGCFGLAWSSDGELLATPGHNGQVTVWAAAAGTPRTITGHDRSATVHALSWHPRSTALASTADDKTVRVWERAADSSRQLCELAARGAAVAWSPNGERIAAVDVAGRIGVWDSADGTSLAGAHLHASAKGGLLWSLDGESLVAPGTSNAILVLDAASLQERDRLRGHRGGIRAVASSADGRYLVSASHDTTIRIWDFATGASVIVLEENVVAVTGVGFSADSRYLVAVSRSGVSQVWRCRDWARVAEYHGYYESLAMHPNEPLVASGNFGTLEVDCYQLDDAVLDRKPAVMAEARQYMNAKVVLLGDSGVGKSGLCTVLSQGSFQATDSTHASTIWMLLPEPTAKSPGSQAKEILLWDLAGQPGYRLTHQLHMNEVSVALLVFDSRSETDPFTGVKYWARALAHSRGLEGDAAVPMKMFLVAGRADRGGVPVSPGRIRALVEDLGLDGFFETSAKEGWQIDELTQAIRDGINWGALPAVSSDRRFDSIKQFLLSEKQRGRVLATADDLWRAYGSDQCTRAAFDASLGRAESRGLIRWMLFGDLILLKPELLDVYASAMVLAARNEPDGLGFIAEKTALAGQFQVSAAERVPDRGQERLLLIATVEELLQHEIALKEVSDQGVDLVFPSQFTRQRPEAPYIPSETMVFAFEGALDSIYATLAVRLARSDLFAREGMWRNAATYSAAGGGVCGMNLRELEGGRGELSLFYDEASAAVRRQFEAYIAAHLRSRVIPGTLTRRTVRICPVCSYALPDNLVRRRLDRGMAVIRCPACDESVIALADEPGPFPDADVEAMNRNADEQRDRSAAELRLMGKIETHDYDVFLCYNSEDAGQVREIAARLRERGILPWFDVAEVPPGHRWLSALERTLSTIKTAAIFIGPQGPGQWQNQEIEGLLLQMLRRRCRLIPVILPGRQEAPRIPPFLDDFNAVDYRETDPDPFERLVDGITR